MPRYGRQDTREAGGTQEYDLAGLRLRASQHLARERSKQRRSERWKCAQQSFGIMAAHWQALAQEQAIDVAG